MAKELNISLGKTELRSQRAEKKGLIKLNNFRNNPSKILIHSYPKRYRSKDKTYN